MPRSILHVLRPLLFLLCVALVALVAAGCGNDLAQDPILALSSEEALDEGKRLLETEKFSRARRYLDHAFEAGPNSASGREALLRGADAHYLQGGRTNYIQCEAKYRDFLNRFPTSQRADYAQFQIANCLFQRMERPDRDQQITRQALAAYEELIQLYPTSGHVPEAEQRMVEVFNNLAESEYMVGSFYVRRGLCGAAIKRLAPLEAQHPNFPDKAKLRYQLGVAYRNCRRVADAYETFDSLAADFPESEYVEEVEKLRSKDRKSGLLDAVFGDANDGDTGDGGDGGNDSGEAQS